MEFSTGEYYHVFNRGVDKRDIFLDKYDFDRFFQSMDEFNNVKPIGSIYENSFSKPQLGHSVSKLVNFISYCLNRNHYHFILEPLVEHGIEKFMHRVGSGYTKYLNNKYSRSGSLFQGKYKAIHINSNEYLLHLSVYVSLNNRIHKTSLGHSVSKLSESSWGEYVGENKHRSKKLCKTDIVLDQFENIEDYKRFAKNSLEFILENREKDEEIKGLLFESDLDTECPSFLI